MKFFEIKPMYGGEAITSVYEEIGGTRELVRLGFEIDGDIESIVSLTYYFAVSKELKEAMENRSFSGVRFSPCDVTPSLNFLAVCPDCHDYFASLSYFQLHPAGQPCLDDVGMLPGIGMLPGYTLVVSERVLGVILEFDPGDMEILPIASKPA